MTGRVESFDGVSIAYEVAGRGSPSVVLVHGLGGDRHQWAAQVDHLSGRMAVVAIDLAGHGESGNSRQVWSIESFGRDVAAVVKTVGSHRVTLVGHSLGGAVILETEGRLDRPVEALIGVDAYVYPPIQRATAAEIQKKMAPFRTDPVGEINRVFRSLFAADADAALVDRTMQGVLKTLPDVLLSSLEALWRWDLEAALAKAVAPVDCVFSKYLNEAAKDLISRHAARLASIAYVDCGHFIMLESPGDFNRYLSDKIAERMGPL